MLDEVNKFIKTIVILFVLAYISYYLIEMFFPSYITINGELFILTTIVAVICAILNIGY